MAKKKEAYVLNYTVGNVAKRTGETRRKVKSWLTRSISSKPSCPFCSVPLIVGGFAVDHKMPLSRGGSPLLSNCWLTCQPCNRAKGDLTVEEFAGLLVALTSLGERAKKSVLARLKIA